MSNERSCERIEADIATLRHIGSGLDGAGRIGSGIDVPEGVRYITLSDTMARRISAMLRNIATRLNNIRQGEDY